MCSTSQLGCKARARAGSIQTNFPKVSDGPRLMFHPGGADVLGLAALARAFKLLIDDLGAGRDEI